MVSMRKYVEITKTGQQAEGKVGGCLRGGYVDGEDFFAVGAAGMVFSAPTSETQDLRFYPYGKKQ